jgi:hypothetical protein
MMPMAALFCPIITAPQTRVWRRQEDFERVEV